MHIRLLLSDTYTNFATLFYILIHGFICTNPLKCVYISLVLHRVFKQVTEQLRHNLNKCLTSHFLSSTKDGHSLSLMLLNLLDSDEQKIQLRGAEYLFDIFSTESILVADLAHSYLVSDETANSSAYKEMVSLGTWQDEKKMLWNIGKKKAAEREELVEVLQRLADYCVIKDNKFLPDPVHQNIAYSCGMHKFFHKSYNNGPVMLSTTCFMLCLCPPFQGIFSSALGYLLQYMSSSKHDHENVVMMSMKLMQAISRTNAKVYKFCSKYTSIHVV